MVRRTAELRVIHVMMLGVQEDVTRELMSETLPPSSFILHINNPDDNECDLKRLQGREDQEIDRENKRQATFKNLIKDFKWSI